MRTSPRPTPPWARSARVTRERVRRADSFLDSQQGLYDRASQVFDLPRESFFLAFAGDGTSRSGAEARLDDYDAFLAHVCRGILSPEGLASAQRDLKGRIVLVFHARRHRDPQHEPEPAAPTPAATFSQWDEDTALALAQSSELELEHEHAAAAEKEQCALDAAEQGRADVLQEASPLEWAPIPMTQATRAPSPSKYPSLADASFERNYQWTWAGPTFPPPPPTTLLSHLPHRAAAAPTVVPAPASTGYSPSYSSAVPVAAEPELEPEEPASSPPVVEAWSGVKVRARPHCIMRPATDTLDSAEPPANLCTRPEPAPRRQLRRGCRLRAPAARVGRERASQQGCSGRGGARQGRGPPERLLRPLPVRLLAARLARIF